MKQRRSDQANIAAHDSKRAKELARFCHREADLKPGDFYLSYNQGRPPVAFQYGEIETREGSQGLGTTRLSDGSVLDLFHMIPDARILIVSKAVAVRSAKEARMF